LGVGEGELGTELSLLPKNRSGSGEVDSAGTFLLKKGSRILPCKRVSCLNGPGIQLPDLGLLQAQSAWAYRLYCTLSQIISKLPPSSHGI
jgi:hypothetical protein